MSKRKLIKIFISSTFSDMHRERDLMHQIEGILNRQLENTDYQISFVDLRYGIDTSAETNEREIEKKILSKCFSEIDECQLFVLFLGERYGSVFDETAIKNIPISKEQAFGKSVTHLEFLYGTQKIVDENKIVFVRDFQGDKSLLSTIYYDEGDGREKLEDLKEHILNSASINYDYSYDASFRDGEFIIDEYVFKKHVTGILEDRIFNYINKNTLSEGCIIEDGIKKEAIHPEIELALKEKIATLDTREKALYKRMVVLRIGELLNQEDYELINMAGGDGKAHLEYRKRLVRDLPLGVEELLKYVSNAIAKNVTNIDGETVCRILNLLAYAQHSTDMVSGCLSEIEIKKVLEDTYDKKAIIAKGILYFDDYIENKSEGIYASSIKSSLAYLHNCGILKHDKYGYGWADEESVALFCHNCCTSDRERLWQYYSDVLWYLPNAMDCYFYLLIHDEFEKFYQCTEKLWCSEVFRDKVLNYLREYRDKENLYLHIERLAEWSVQQEKGEIFLIFILFVLFDPNDDEIFYEVWVPLCQKTYIRYGNRCGSRVKLIQRFFLFFLYEEFAIELKEPTDSFLTVKETEEMRVLFDSACEINYLPELHNAEEYVDALRNLRSYYGEWNDLIIILQIIALRNGCDRFDVIISFFNECFEKNCLTENQFKNFLINYLKVGCDIEFFLEEENLKKFNDCIWDVFRDGDYNLCLYMFHVLYNSICMEERIRKAPWLRWVYYLNYEIVSELYNETKDTILREILVALEDNLFVEHEDLVDFDDECLRRAEKIDF